MAVDSDNYVILGRISGFYGVKGWVKIFSETQPRDGILRYHPWFVNKQGEWQSLVVERGQNHGKGVIAKLEGCDDRDQAVEFLNCEIAVKRDQIPESGDDGYYWTDLQGMQVTNTQGVDFGIIDRLFETGSNDVMVVQGERERLVPFIMDQVVVEVNLQSKQMQVDWDEDF